MDYDVFNGDADGILSLVQLRLSDPREAELVTGRKRDIKLLDRVKAGQNDRVTVLDISMRSNLVDLNRILGEGASVLYFDHHNAGEGAEHPNLESYINTAGEICTAVLVDQYLEGAHRAWAVAASYGDNFPAMAERLANGHDLPLGKLKSLGEMVNYKFKTPMAFLSEKPEVIGKLLEGYADDFRMAEGSKVLKSNPSGEVRVLPDAAASRRISGMFGNKLAQEHKDRAHAILTQQPGGYLVSIRAPISKREGADALALQFETGGGRAAAAGVNHLPDAELDRFVDAFQKAF